MRTREGNTFTAHPVKIGISNGVNTEIISGINEGTVVVTEVTIGSMPGRRRSGPEAPGGSSSPRETTASTISMRRCPP